MTRMERLVTGSRGKLEGEVKRNLLKANVLGIERRVTATMGIGFYLPETIMTVRDA